MATAMLRAAVDANVVWGPSHLCVSGWHCCCWWRAKGKQTPYQAIVKPIVIVGAEKKKGKMNSACRTVQG